MLAAEVKGLSIQLMEAAAKNSVEQVLDLALRYNWLDHMSLLRPEFPLVHRSNTGESLDDCAEVSLGYEPVRTPT